MLVLASAQLVVVEEQLRRHEAQEAEITALGIDLDAMQREVDEDLRQAHEDQARIDRMVADIDAGVAVTDEEAMELSEVFAARDRARGERQQRRTAARETIQAIEATYAAGLA